MTGRNSRTFVAKKRDVGNHGVVPLGMATGQGGGLGHGSPKKGLLKALGTEYTGFLGEDKGSKRKKVDREVEQF